MRALQGRPGQRSEPRARRPLARRFTYRYVAALVVVAMLGAWSLVSIDHTLQDADRANHRLENAAAQPGLVHQITESSSSALTALEDGDEGQVRDAADELARAADDLRETQQALVEGGPELGPADAALAPQLEELYLGSGELADRVDEFGGAAEALATGVVENEEASEELLDVLGKAPGLVADLDQAVAIYSSELARVLDEQRDAMFLRVAVSVAILALLVLVLFRPMARKIQQETTQLEAAERLQRENSERQSFRNDLFKALDVCDDEREVLETVERAVLEVVPELPAELLMADADQERLAPGAVNPRSGGAGCPVDRPEACPALRASQTMLYASSRMLNVCPKLPLHDDVPCSAVCVPLAFNGKAVGVLHVTAEENAHWETTSTERLKVIAGEVSNRIGTLRITRATERLARHDVLTDLGNRRTLQEQVRQLLDDDVPFSLAMADLDHFKDLNDTYGHETGDRALQLFASCLRKQLRPQDIIARYGGEEFVVVFPQTDLHHAARAIERLQAALVDEAHARQAVPFTASWGLTDSGAGRTFESILNIADLAMYDAKRAGRNCLVIDGEAAARQSASREASMSAEHPGEAPRR